MHRPQITACVSCEQQRQGCPWLSDTMLNPSSYSDCACAVTSQGQQQVVGHQSATALNARLLLIHRDSNCKEEIGGEVRETIFRGTRKSITLLEGFQATPARPSFVFVDFLVDFSVSTDYSFKQH
jgi:hypothetical protein